MTGLRKKKISTNSTKNKNKKNIYIYIANIFVKSLEKKKGIYEKGFK